MSVLDKIKEESERFGIVAEFINPKKLKLYSKNYVYDGWIAELDKNEIHIYHRNTNRIKKLSYHKQSTIKTRNWIWVLERIKDHDHYRLNYKWNSKINLVDRVLGEYNKEKKNATKYNKRNGRTNTTVSGASQITL